MIDLAPRLVADIVGLLPRPLVRAVGRWFMKGAIRRSLFGYVTHAVQAEQGGRIRAGPMAGLRFRGGDTAGYLLGASEPAVQEALVDHLSGGAVFYDVGANVGYFSLLGCRRVGSDGEVHCFEPLEANVRVLRRNLEENRFRNYRIHQVAVADRSGSAEMVLADEPGRTRLSDARQDAGERTVVVPLACLDELGLPPPDVVKIDVEGAESRVLRGMTRLLREHRPVLIIELHGDQRAPVVAALADADYGIADLADAGGMPHVVAAASGGA
jgi:FkbM family methyltransferase